MAPESDLDPIAALLDGRPLAPGRAAGISGNDEPICIIDGIARAYRTLLFGGETALDDRIPSTWGHLEIRGELGRGASATVYRAYDTRLRREVALKLLAPDASTAAAALDEGRLLARLDHPHIVDVFGV